MLDGTYPVEELQRQIESIRRDLGGEDGIKSIQKSMITLSAMVTTLNARVDNFGTWIESIQNQLDDPLDTAMSPFAEDPPDWVLHKKIYPGSDVTLKDLLHVLRSL